MTAINDTIAVPNFGEPKFYGVESKPDTMIVEIWLQNGDAVAFCITPDELKEFGQRCFAQAALHLGEIECDGDAVSAINGMTVN